MGLKEFLVCNKFFGFEQLNYLQSMGVKCIPIKEVDSDALLGCPEKLWSIETVVYSGDDFYLPEIHGINGADALTWITEQEKQEEKNYRYMCSPYFDVIKCGKIQIELNSTIIEGVKGNFYNLEHNDLDIRLECRFDLCYKKFVDNGVFSDLEIFDICNLARRIKSIYLPELEDENNLIYWINYAFGRFVNNTSEHKKDCTLIVTGLRSKLAKNERLLDI